MEASTTAFSFALPAISFLDASVALNAAKIFTFALTEQSVVASSANPLLSARLPGSAASPLLRQTGAPANVLAQIWTLCDTGSMGSLSFIEFGLALHLALSAAAAIRNGLDPGSVVPGALPQNILTEIALFHNHANTTASGDAANQEKNKLVKRWKSACLPGKLAVYISEFSANSGAQKSGYLPHEAPKISLAKFTPLLQASGLPRPVLAQVWDMLAKCCGYETKDGLFIDDFLAAKGLVAMCHTFQGTADPNALSSSSSNMAQLGSTIALDPKIPEEAKLMQLLQKTTCVLPASSNTKTKNDFVPDAKEACQTNAAERLQKYSKKDLQEAATELQSLVTECQKMLDGPDVDSVFNEIPLLAARVLLLKRKSHDARMRKIKNNSEQISDELSLEERRKAAAEKLIEKKLAKLSSQSLEYSTLLSEQRSSSTEFESWLSPLESPEKLQADFDDFVKEMSAYTALSKKNLIDTLAEAKKLLDG